MTINARIKPVRWISLSLIYVCCKGLFGVHLGRPRGDQSNWDYFLRGMQRLGWFHWEHRAFSVASWEYARHYMPCLDRHTYFLVFTPRVLELWILWLARLTVSFDESWEEMKVLRCSAAIVLLLFDLRLCRPHWTTNLRFRFTCFPWEDRLASPCGQFESGHLRS